MMLRTGLVAVLVLLLPACNGEQEEHESYYDPVLVTDHGSSVQPTSPLPNQVLHDGIRIIDKSDTASRNACYGSNQAPLAPNMLIKLPIGSIQPKGWLLEFSHKVHRNMADWSRLGHLPSLHNVNIAQAFREPETTLPDYRGLRYLTAPNRIVSDVENHSPGLANADPLSIYAQGKQITAWGIDGHGLVGAPQDSPVKSDVPAQRIEFIPMDTARLRISAFPVIGDGGDGRAWHGMA